MTEKYSIVKKSKRKATTKEFAFYLDAWLYCTEFNIPMEYVSRRDWKTWVLKVPTTPKVKAKASVRK